MAIRVPLLLQKSIAVIYRLDITATRAVNPPGEETAGFDEEFQEVIRYDESASEPETRTSARQEMTPVYLPCQIEMFSDEALRELGVGDDPILNMGLVLHRKDLTRLSLIDANGNCVLKSGDRLDHLEKYGAAVGTTTKTFDKDVYLTHVMDRSWGFGPSGFDLVVCTLSHRRLGTTS